MSKLLKTLLFSLFCFSAFASWNLESKRVDYLLLEIGNSEAVFLRNGDEHSAKDARKHLKSKLSFGINSWFSPSRDKWTAEMFIEKIASKSSFSGNIYQMRLKSGEVVTTSSWLKAKLKEYRP